MKRCPKCGRNYEDYWRVCLEDGEPLIDVKTIHKTRELETFKPLSKREAEEERRQALLFFFTISLFVSIIVCILVAIFSGNPFSAVISRGKIAFLATIIHNAGVVTGVFIVGAALTIPVSILWWRRS